MDIQRIEPIEAILILKGEILVRRSDERRGESRVKIESGPRSPSACHFESHQYAGLVQDLYWILSLWR